MARFERLEKSDGCVLRSVFGNGKTPYAAAIDHFRKIENKIMVKNAMCQDRKEIRVPLLTTDGLQDMIHPDDCGIL
jgi:hypothetical protein